MIDDDAVVCLKCGCLVGGQIKPNKPTAKPTTPAVSNALDAKISFLDWLPLALGVIAIVSAIVKSVLMFDILYNLFNDISDYTHDLKYSLSRFTTLYWWFSHDDYLGISTLFCMPPAGALAIFMAIPGLKKQNKLPAIFGLVLGALSLIVPIIARLCLLIID